MKYYKGEVVAVSMRTGFDWTGATTKQVIILRPDLTKITFTAAAVIVDDAATGQIHVVTASGDLNQLGQYLIQAKMATASVTRFSEIQDFFVEDVLT